jgi:hypothetical protein
MGEIKLLVIPTGVWEMSTDENVPNEKVLNCTNVAEINIVENKFLNYMR